MNIVLDSINNIKKEVVRMYMMNYKNKAILTYLEGMQDICTADTSFCEGNLTRNLIRIEMIEAIIKKVKNPDEEFIMDLLLTQAV